MGPFRRSRRPGPAATVAAHALRLARVAERIGVVAASVRERERDLDERDRHLRSRLRRGAHELDERAEALTAFARALADRERRVAELEDGLRGREARLVVDELRRRGGGDEAESPARRDEAELRSCVLFVPSADGYRLVSLEAAAPRSGQRVEVDGEAFAVLRVGPSPLPDDDRPCAFLAA